MAEKITSIAELEKAIEYAFVKGEFVHENIMFALKQFKVGLKRRIISLEEQADRGEYNDAVAAKELRGIVGEDVCDYENWKDGMWRCSHPKQKEPFCPIAVSDKKNCELRKRGRRADAE